MIIKGKEMIKDTTFEFEKKRNEPLVYNRDVYISTIKAMKKVNEIKEKRETLFIENRFKKIKFIQNIYKKNICKLNY